MTLATRLKAVRQVHNYVGVFFAPTILFFALTGGLQMFGLHEKSQGSAYDPPALLVRLAQLHKKGTLYRPQSKRPATPPAPNTPAAIASAPRPDSPNGANGTKTQVGSNPLPMKIFFAGTAFALVLSTCTGLCMAWQYARRKMVVLLLFGAGIVCPVLALLV